MDKPAIYRIVLTGGPCGGKSTALAHIAERMQALGFTVYRVPEAATIVLGGGVEIRDMPPEVRVGLQEAILKVMMNLEEAFYDMAQYSKQPVIVLCDRGVMDVQAYLDDQAWTALLDEHNWTPVGLRDKRYEAVLHLVTAADGAEAFYTTENNAVRSETPEHARRLDARVRDAWIGHPHLRVIDNSTDFTHKVQRVVAAVCQVTGVPEPLEIERKYLVRRAPSISEMPVACQEFDIEQTYLISPDGTPARVRRRGQNGAYVYTHTIKRSISPTQRVEVEHQITGREYIRFLSQADPDRRPIRKRRRVFLWSHRYFELDTFISPRPGMQLLEIELDDENSPVELPPFIEIVEEVTEDAQYQNQTLAKAKA